MQSHGEAAYRAVLANTGQDGPGAYGWMVDTEANANKGSRHGVMEKAGNKTWQSMATADQDM